MLFIQPARLAVAAPEKVLISRWVYSTHAKVLHAEIRNRLLTQGDTPVAAIIVGVISSIVACLCSRQAGYLTEKFNDSSHRRLANPKAFLRAFYGSYIITGIFLAVAGVCLYLYYWALIPVPLAIAFLANRRGFRTALCDSTGMLTWVLLDALLPSTTYNHALDEAFKTLYKEVFRKPEAWEPGEGDCSYLRLRERARRYVLQHYRQQILKTFADHECEPK